MTETTWTGEARELHARLQQINMEWIALRHRMRSEMSELPDEELVDVGFFHRETNRLADEMRKDASKWADLIGKLLCHRITQRVAEDPTKDMKAAGQHASCTPHLQMRPIMPSPNSDRHDAALREMGVPQSAIDSGVITFHYQKMRDLLSEKAQNGETPFDGLIERVPNATVSYRGRKQKS